MRRITTQDAKALVAKYGSQSKAAKAAGVAKSTLWEALRRESLAAPSLGFEAEVLSLRRELALERSKLSALCQARGSVTLVKTPENTLKFGVISDTHVGSMYFNDTAFDAMFRYYKSLDIKDVLCAGDILSGHKVYKGHEYEVSELGFGKQLQKLLSLDTHGATVKFITGNHDLSFKALAGVRVGEEIAAASKNWEFLGDEQADVEFTTPKGPYRVRLIHPGGGTAYAVSYKVQKIIDSLGGGSKPNMIIAGHFHKSEFMPSYRNVAAMQGGCFNANAVVKTDSGGKPIGSIAPGDMVLTHANRYRKVVQHLKRRYEGPWRKIQFGRLSSGEYLTCTSDHPVLTRRNGETETVWRSAKDVNTGDIVYVVSKSCSVCGEPVPYWGKMCPLCNPMDSSGTRSRATLARHDRSVGPVALSSKYSTSTAQKHLLKDIVPGCLALQKEGWDIIPVSGAAIPDAVGFKDGKLCLFEFENSHRVQLERKQLKYAEANWLKPFPHAVRWIDCSPRKERVQATIFDGPPGFVGVEVISAESSARKESVVHNLEVADDESYVCQNVVVHNCFENQTPFMARMGIAAHVGGWVVEVTVGETYNIIKTEFVPFYA